MASDGGRVRLAQQQQQPPHRSKNGKFKVMARSFWCNQRKTVDIQVMKPGKVVSERQSSCCGVSRGQFG